MACGGGAIWEEWRPSVGVALRKVVAAPWGGSVGGGLLRRRLVLRQRLELRWGLERHLCFWRGLELVVQPRQRSSYMVRRCACIA